LCVDDWGVAALGRGGRRQEFPHGVGIQGTSYGGWVVRAVGEQLGDLLGKAKVWRMGYYGDEKVTRDGWQGHRCGCLVRPCWEQATARDVWSGEERRYAQSGDNGGVLNPFSRCRSFVSFELASTSLATYELRTTTLSRTADNHVSPRFCSSLVHD